jgi:hypothetical protein
MPDWRGPRGEKPRGGAAVTPSILWSFAARAQHDPVNLGLVTSFNHPGGNVTGMSVFTIVDQIAFTPPPSQGKCKDIELAMVSQRVSGRFRNRLSVRSISNTGPLVAPQHTAASRQLQTTALQ